MQGNSFKTLKILHTALTFGLASFLIVAYILVSQEMMPVNSDKTMETAFQAVAAVISFGCLVAGFTIFRKQMTAARNATPADVRFGMYRGACVVWWAMLEGPGLFATVAYLLTGNLVFIVLALFHLGLLIVFMPRKDNIIVLLNLTSDDVQKLEGGTF